MDKFVIRGGNPLLGTINVSGAKNAALPCIAAALLTEEPVILENIPQVRDIETTRKLLAAMGERNIPADAIQQITVDRGDITFYLDREHLVAVCQMLRDDPALRFELCSSVSAVDYGVDVPNRLHTVYHLTSMTYRRRIRLEVAVDVADAHTPSVVGVYPTADWQERENWDMFGIIYDGHPALTRILMPDDWDGHPQRKDYPLGGIPVEYKGAEIPPPDQRRAYS